VFYRHPVIWTTFNAYTCVVAASADESLARIGRVTIVHNPAAGVKKQACFIVALPSIICSFQILLESVTSRDFRVVSPDPLGSRKAHIC
jgi:hypothetical protein